MMRSITSLRPIATLFRDSFDFSIVLYGFTVTRTIMSLLRVRIVVGEENVQALCKTNT